MNSAAVVGVSLAFLALLLTGLSLHISRLRLCHRVSYGDGGHKGLMVAIRAHGNCLEQTCVFGLLALACALLQQSGSTVLDACCAGFVVARVFYVSAVFQRWLLLRQAAHLASLLAQLGLVALVAAQVL